MCPISFTSSLHCETDMTIKMAALAVVGSLLLGALLWRPMRPRVTAPVVSPTPRVETGLPEFPEAMKSARDICEKLGHEVRAQARHGDISAKNYSEARTLYTAAKDDLDGCINVLSDGLAIGLGPQSLDFVNVHLVDANTAMNAFSTWATSQLHRESPKQRGPLQNAIELQQQWLSALPKKQSNSMNELRDELGRCRLTSWKDL